LSVGFEGVCKAFCVLLEVLEINIFWTYTCLLDECRGRGA
jgi:hypothetical protein